MNEPQKPPTQQAPPKITDQDVLNGINDVVRVLTPLNPDARARVLRTVAQFYGINKGAKK